MYESSCVIRYFHASTCAASQICTICLSVKTQDLVSRERLISCSLVCCPADKKRKREDSSSSDSSDSSSDSSDSEAETKKKHKKKEKKSKKEKKAKKKHKKHKKKDESSSD